jgi:hypothetical protein
VAESGERPASIKLTLDAGEYLVELKKVGEQNKKTSDDGQRKFKAMGAGIDAAKRSLGGMLDTAKQGIRTLATLGGAFTVGQSVKGAVELQAQYRQLAFNASEATGSLITAKDVQLTVDRVAAKTTRTNEELTKSYVELFQATGDLEFSGRAIASIGTVATATGKNVDTLTGLAGTLNEKFGVTAATLDDAFATIIGNTDKGGVKLTELAEVGDQLGANLLQAGLRGERGLRFLLGSLNKVEGEMGGMARASKGVGQILLNLGKGSELKAMAKDLGLDPKKLINEKDAIARLMKILSFGKKGLDTLKANFVGPEEQKALRLLFTDPFESALQRAKDSGLKGKDAIEQAMRVLEGQIADFGKSTTTAKSLQEQAAKEAKEPTAALRQALNTLNVAFAQPEMIQAVNDLAKMLPGLAKALGNLLSFAAKHPLLATSGAIGIKAGASFVGAIASQMTQTIVEAHIKGATKAGDKILSKLMSGGKGGVGGSIGGAAGLAFKAAAVLAAGAIGFEIGNAIAPHIIDPLVNKDLKKTRDVEGGTEAAIAGSGGRGSTSMLLEKQRKLQAAIDAERNAKLGSGVMDGMISMAGGPDVEKMSQDRIARAEQALAALKLRILQGEGDRFGQPRAAAKPTADAAAPRKVSLDSGAPRAIAGALVDGLSGKTLTVRLERGSGGIVAQPRSAGGHGPRPQPPAQPGGGV